MLNIRYNNAERFKQFRVLQDSPWCTQGSALRGDGGMDRRVVALWLQRYREGESLDWKVSGSRIPDFSGGGNVLTF